jgi:hypothetical protein
MSFIGYKLPMVSSGTWKSTYNANATNDPHPETAFEMMDDARHKDDWVPDVTNLAGPACMALMNNGLLEILEGGPCQSLQQPVCEHRCECTPQLATTSKN